MASLSQMNMLRLDFSPIHKQNTGAFLKHVLTVLQVVIIRLKWSLGSPQTLMDIQLITNNLRQALLSPYLLTNISIQLLLYTH